MAYNKITMGFVVQTFNDDGVPMHQDFIAGDDVSYESEEGESIEQPNSEGYLPFDMYQPK